jgi:hypothetical protein
MGKIYRSAMGKNIDIDTLRLTNEDAIAVGNMKVNARGDQLGAGGQVIQGRNQTMDKYYNPQTPVTSSDAHRQATVESQRRAGASVKQGQVRTAPPVPQVDPDGVPFDHEPVEPVAKTAPLRGSFADSIAREVTVTQDLLTPPNQPKGPTRI